MSLVEMVLDDARRMKTITHSELYRLNDAIFNRKEGDKLTSKVIWSLMAFVRRASHIFENNDSVTQSPHFVTGYRALLGTLQNQTTLLNTKQQIAILQLLRDAIPAPLPPINEIDYLSGMDESTENSASGKKHVKPTRRGGKGRRKNSNSNDNDWIANGENRQQFYVAKELQRGSTPSQKGGKNKENYAPYGHMAHSSHEPQQPKQQWQAREQTAAQPQALNMWANLRRPYPGPESMSDAVASHSHSWEEREKPAWDRSAKPTGQRHRRAGGNERGTKKRNDRNNRFSDADHKAEHRNGQPRASALDEEVYAV